jgi:hypothetical protein
MKHTEINFENDLVNYEVGLDTHSLIVRIKITSEDKSVILTMSCEQHNKLRAKLLGISETKINAINTLLRNEMVYLDQADKKCGILGDEEF